MLSKILRITLLISLGAIFVFVAVGQDLENCAYIRRLPGQEPLPDNIRERMMTLCIEEHKKEFQELIDRSEEVAKLTVEIDDSFQQNKKLSKDDKKKLKEIENLLKKIRKEMRADDDDDDDDKEKPASTLEAIKELKVNTSNLLDEIKKTTRYSISAAAIQSSNSVLKIVRFLRFGK